METSAEQRFVSNMEQHPIDSHLEILREMLGVQLDQRTFEQIAANKDRPEEREPIKILGNLLLVEAISGINWEEYADDLHVKEKDPYFDIHVLPDDGLDPDKTQDLLETSLHLVAEYIKTHNLQETHKYLIGITYSSLARLAGKSRYGFERKKIDDTIHLPPTLMDYIARASQQPHKDKKRTIEPYVVYREVKDLLHDPHYAPKK